MRIFDVANRVGPDIWAILPAPGELGGRRLEGVRLRDAGPKAGRVRLRLAPSMDFVDALSLRPRPDDTFFIIMVTCTNCQNRPIETFKENLKPSGAEGLVRVKGI